MFDMEIYYFPAAAKPFEWRNCSSTFNPLSANPELKFKNMKRLIALLLSRLLLGIVICSAFGGLQPVICNLYAQPVTQEWVRRYNEPSNMNDHTTSLALDKLGNVIVTGYCQTSTQSTNIVTVKYSPSGVQQWVVPFNYQSNVADEPDAMVIDTAGNIYIAASCGSFFTEIYDCVLLKYKPTGTLEWFKGYGNFTGAFAAKDLIIDRQGNIYVAGNTNVPTPNSIFLLKYSPEGDTVWTRKYKEPGYIINYAETIALDSLNNIIIGGECVVNSSYSGGESLVLKYSSTGSYLWSATYNSGGVNTSDVIYKVGIDYNGNVYATGMGNYSPDMLTIKYNSAGTMQWLRLYNGFSTGGDNAASLAIDITGNIYITGPSMGPTFNYYDYVTIKYNSNGDSLWVKRYNGTGNGGGAAYDIELDDSSNVYVVGYGGGNISTIKYTTTGTQQWVAQYPGGLTNLYVGKRLKVNSQRNVYVIGNNSDSGTGIDYITIKYSQLVGLNPISANIPSEFELSQNYPNPFNPVTKIKFEIPKPTYVKITISDLLGKYIETVVDERLNTGEYEKTWNGNGYSSGIYFYTMFADGNRIESKKMVIAK